MSYTTVLRDTDSTLRFGRTLASVLPQQAPYPALLLKGDLGAGKTTMTRGLVEALPGGGDAEVASPSFTLMHLYPTRPECAHIDLYRLEGMRPDASIQEVLEQDNLLVIIEWAEYLPENSLPEEHMLLSWRTWQSGRELTIDAHGNAAASLLERLRSAWPEV